jgi:NAD-dependent DNA ligase
MKTIVPPKICPSCMTDLVWEKDQIFCHNTQCGGKTSKKIEHFASTLKIKGLGPRTVEKLQIIDLYDIYELPLEIMIEALQSEKLAVKLHREIQSSKATDLVDLLPAFSIKLIGRSASAKLCSVIKNMAEISEDTCKEAGLGPVATEHLLDWYYEEFIDGYERLPFRWIQTLKVSKPTENQEVVCISGKLKSYKTKAQATEYLEKLGYLVKSSLTKDVTILVNESGIESAKTRTALERGVKIITNLNEIIGK